VKKLLFILTLCVFSCEKESAYFYVNGKLCTTKETCIKEEIVPKFYGPSFVFECIEWRIDTIEVK
jgi:hypothetical protein